MERREVLGLGGLAALAGVLAPTHATQADNAESTEGRTRVVRIYADEAGNSHIEELVVATTVNGQPRQPPTVPATGVVVREYQPGRVVDWHTAPNKQFAITIVGELEVEVSGGVRRQIGKGDLVFLEDAKGKGHITRLQGRVTNLFIRVPPDFDVVSWARG